MGDDADDFEADDFDADDFGAAQPGLGRLFATLTTAPSAAELAGEPAVLEMFRASRRGAGATLPPGFGPDAVAPPGGPGDPGGPPGPLAPWMTGVPGQPGAAGGTAGGAAGGTSGGAAAGGALGTRARRPAVSRRLLAVAAAIVLIGGFAAAAYTAALPTPVQHVAYRVLGFIGVPDSGASPSTEPRHQQAPGGPPPAASPSSRAPGTGQASTRPAGRATGSPSPGHSASPSPGQSASPSPSPSQSSSPPPVPVLAVSLAAPKIGAGSSDQVIATATSGGGALPGVPLRFQEHSAGHRGWHLAGRARTGQDGQASLTVSGLLVNTFFRVAGSGGAHSPAVRVKVIPVITLAMSVRPQARQALLTASCPDARPGDIVLLQKLLQGIWQTTRTGRLGAGRKKAFTVELPAHVSRRFRVVLLPTVRHARSVSGPVLVPHRTA